MARRVILIFRLIFIIITFEFMGFPVRFLVLLVTIEHTLAIGATLLGWNLAYNTQKSLFLHN